MDEIKLSIPATHERCTINNPKRTARGRYYVPGNRVSVGRIEVEDTNLTEAKRRVAERVLAACEVAGEAPYIVCREGTALVVYSDGGGTWSYGFADRIGPTGSTQGIETKERAIASATHHLVQLTTDYGSDESLVATCRWLDEHRRLWVDGAEWFGDLIEAQFKYAAWQRARTRAEELAIDGDRHRWAGDHEKEFRPTVDWRSAA